MRTFGLFILIVTVGACGGSGNDAFSFLIDGLWRGAITQADAISCVASDGSVSTIGAGFGTTLREGTFSIAGGAADGDAVQVMRDDGCELRGMRTSDSALEVFPQGEPCPASLTSIRFTFASAQEAQVVEDSDLPSPPGPDAEGPVCSVDTAGDLTRD